MNNVRMKLIIYINRQLSAAPDSDAKADLIEELSENLYGRYQDMVAAGMPEDEAYAAALDKLGDVNELLAYLDCCGKQESGTDGPRRDGAADDWFNSLGSMIRQTVDQAVNAATDAAAMVRDAADKLRDSDGIRFSTGGAGDQRVTLRFSGDGAEPEFLSEGLEEIKVSIVGDLTVYLDGDPNAPVRLEGDTDDLQVQTEGAALTITQDKSAGGSFFFSRGLSSASIELTIPQRHWNRLELSTASGDVDICCDSVLEAEDLAVKTTSGDMELDSLEVERLVVQTSSGDLSLTDSTCGSLLFHSASGDLEGVNVTAAVLAQTASGDVSLSGNIRDLKVQTASGDMELDCETLPEVLMLNTKSGDCSVSLPDNDGFILRYATVSGELESDFPLTTAAGSWRDRRGGCSGEAYYQNGGDGRAFALTTVSGNIELRQN